MIGNKSELTDMLYEICEQIDDFVGPEDNWPPMFQWHSKVITDEELMQHLMPLYKLMYRLFEDL